ncbi:MAG: hypothetical protein ACLQNE_32305 [Thermoguttaceae bacterium]
MAVAYFVSLEREIAGVRSLQRCGKAIAQNIVRLDAAAKTLDLTPLTRLLQTGAADLEEMLEYGAPDRAAPYSAGDVEPLSDDSPAGFDGQPQDGVWALDDEVAPEQWFDAVFGSHIVHGLARYVRAHPADFERPEELIAELDDVQRILQAAEVAGVRFRLSVDV